MRFEREVVRRRLQEALTAIDQAAAVEEGSKEQVDQDLMATLFLMIAAPAVADYLDLCHKVAKTTDDAEE